MPDFSIAPPQYTCPNFIPEEAVKREAPDFSSDASWLELSFPVYNNVIPSGAVAAITCVFRLLKRVESADNEAACIPIRFCALRT